MSMRRFKLNRRALLRGMVGGAFACVALPTLEAMLNSHGTAYADGGQLPLRIMTWFFGNGVRLDKWIPQKQGSGYDLTPELAPLVNVQDYVSVLTGFQNMAEIRITHHEGMTLFNGFTMVQVSGLFSKAGGPTVDQVAAQYIGSKTPIESVQLGCSKRLSIMDSGTTMHNLSHKGTEQPLPPEFNPVNVYNKLFGSFTPKDDPSKPVRHAVLDSVKSDITALEKRIGAKDKMRLEAHLDGIRELEKKIDALPPACTKPGVPTETNADVNGKEPIESVNEVMSELLAYAFTCDITRIASYLWIGGAAETIFDDLNQVTTHHSNTHNAAAQDEVHQGVIYIMQRLAYMLEKFKATPDGPVGNLLDNMAILIGSDCSEGLTHDIFDQAVLVAGRAGGQLVHPGIHYRSPNAENTTDITLAVLQTVAPQVTEMGGGKPYSNTPLKQLKGS